MKRKLSFLVAAVMVLSLLPAMGVSAASSNTMQRSGNTVADDYDWHQNVAATPVLRVKTDKDFTSWPQGASEADPIKVFGVTLDNAKWDWNDDDFVARGYFQKEENGAGADQTQGAYNLDNDTLTVKSTPTQQMILSEGALKTEIGYKMQFVTDSYAEVSVIDDLTTLASNHDDLGLYIPLPIKMDGEGPATVQVAAQGGYPIANGTYTIATGTTGSTTLSVKDSDKSFNKDLSIGALTVTETSPRTIDNGTNDYIEFIAPSGFEWQESQSSAVAKGIMGFSGTDNANFEVETGDSQTLRYGPLSGSKINGLGTSNTAGAIEFTGLVLTREGKTNDTPTGDVKVRVKVPGGSDDRVTVGTFANKGITLTVQDKEVPEIITGSYYRDPKEETTRTLEFTIKESAANTWNADSDAVFTLNDEAKFRGVEVMKVSGVSNLAKNDEVTLTSDLRDGKPSSDADSHFDKTDNGKTSRIMNLEDDAFTLKNLARKGNDNFEITLRCYVTVKPGYTGDITFKTDEDNDAFGADLSGVIAKAIDPFTVTTKQTDVQIGYMGIALGDITLKENKAGALKKTTNNDDVYNDDTSRNYRFWIGGYEGVNFKDEGKYEVVSGDISIDKYELNDGMLELDVKRESSTPSELKFTGMTMDASRSVPEGKLQLRIGGVACANYYGDFSGSARDYGSFNIEYFIADDGYVNVVTAAPDKDTKYTTEVAVTVGSKTIKANKIDYTLDVAPFIQDGYTMIPVRATAVAMGINDDQIKWDANTRTVTILDTNRGRTSQFVEKAHSIIVNSMSVPFEGPAAMITEGRTFLPFRALGEIVLGCPVNWDPATQTAWFNKGGAGAAGSQKSSTASSSTSTSGSSASSSSSSAA